MCNCFKNKALVTSVPHRYLVNDKKAIYIVDFSRNQQPTAFTVNVTDRNYSGKSVDFCCISFPSVWVNHKDPRSKSQIWHKMSCLEKMSNSCIYFVGLCFLCWCDSYENPYILPEQYTVWHVIMNTETNDSESKTKNRPVLSIQPSKLR